MSHLLGLQAAGLPLGKAWTFGHAPEYRTGVRVFSSPPVSWVLPFTFETPTVQ